ncbi:guanylate kinase [Helcococcus ovis]
MMDGFLLVLSGPSGVGKGTIVKEIIKQRDDIVTSISVTTRYKRETEEEGREYFFKTVEEFNELVNNNALLEHAVVHGNKYGTPKHFVEEKIKEGKIVILEIDFQGAIQVMNNFDNAVYVFVLPPRKKDIEDRLRHRGTESEEKIKTRLETAEKELEQLKLYDYYLVNDYIDLATKRLSDIMNEEKAKRRQ